MILWGPPGSGKTTLARIISETTERPFIQFSAVISGIREIRDVMKEAERELDVTGRNVILFIDEIHRFNKAQQDAFLPYIENGTVILIGATTENPSFELNSPLLSRCRVYILSELDLENLKSIMRRALTDSERGLGASELTWDDEALSFIAAQSGGDARNCLNCLEIAADRAGRSGHIGLDTAKESVKRENLFFDKKGELYYNTISAFHKALRGSDVQAALYWLARMLEGGQDPMYIVRRMVRFASEDVGLADPEALVAANAAKEAAHFLGMPECNTALAQAAVYLAAAPKSNALYTAYKRAARDVREHPDAQVPLHIRNAPTSLMKQAGYGKGYVYEHDTPEKLSAQEFLPEGLAGAEYYVPGELGFEKDMRKRLDYYRQLKEKLKREQQKE
jgi:putative ATPase